MNHRTRTDWNFFWPAIYHAAVGKLRWGQPTKFVLKDDIRKIPGIGWVMEMASFFYIKRQWHNDKKTFHDAIDYFHDLNYKFNLLIFPEGTDLSPDNKKKSDKFAIENNLPKYEHVLHPRTTGFVYLASRLIRHKTLDAIYDVTVVYCDTIPQSESFLLKGLFPKQIKFHFKKYDAKNIQPDDETLKKFLQDRWHEKEQFLAHYTNNQSIPIESAGVSTSESVQYRCRGATELYVALIFWTLFPYAVIYLLTISPFYRRLVLLHTLFYLFVSNIGYGFQSFQIMLYNIKRRLFNYG
jgi:lysocardiolipin and lysophospholipid acyltransferase